ncbi:MAG: WecB/TagA/CpsF family glycosyltransferase [Pilosibacter sp.]|uniref:WecB/TagA/CpsF family glycosyltransferase n=1 Tax=Clostridium sp. MCC328 TaxID=2592642 RepID=UPI0031F5F587
MVVDTNRIEFLNTYIDNLTASEAKNAVDSLIQAGGNHYVVTPNSDIVVKMQDDTELKEICDKADLILTDGQIVVKLSRYLGNPIKERVCMTDFVWDVFDLAIKKDYRVFLFGGKEDVLFKATENIKKRLPELNIVDSYSPPFGFEKNEEMLEEANRRIKASDADILIVFLGCPKQEKFIYQNKDKYQVPISITMGGCVDFIAGKVKRAPLWMQNIGLEWFYRFLQEPKRMFRRYFVDDIRIFELARKYQKHNS